MSEESQRELAISIRLKAKRLSGEIFVGRERVTYTEAAQRLLENLTEQERGFLLEGAAASVMQQTAWAIQSLMLNARLN